MNAPRSWNDWFTVFDNTDVWGGLLILGAGVAVLLILIPILLFGLEFVIAGVLLATALGARLFLGKPWTVEARALDGSEQVLRWRVVGWRRSKRLIVDVSQQLATGQQLHPEDKDVFAEPPR